MINLLNKNKNINSKWLLLTVIMATGFLVLPVYFGYAQETNINSNTNTDNIVNTNSTSTTPTGQENQNISEIDRQIREKELILQELKKKQESYEQSLKIKEQEASSLQNQLSLIDIQILKTENNIDRIKTEIDEINLEIENLKAQIADKEQELADKKEKLAQYIRVLYKYEQKTYLEIIIKNNSFSDFFDQLKYSEELEKSVKGTLDNIKALKQQLEDRKGEREAKKQELSDLKTKLEGSISDLDSQKVYKTNLLEETKSSEAKFQDLLEQAKLEQQQADADINNLQRKAQEKLEQGGVEKDNSSADLSWPASSEKGISAYFHDPTYIFRKYFEHPAIDIRIAQGTEVKSAASGYVARAKNAGFGYSYIMIVHNDELATVYGHMSRIDVQEDTYVVRGQVIGLSGGTPGTPGAGRLTTGPHLHFEVRVNGIPVNPLDYLP